MYASYTKCLIALLLVLFLMPKIGHWKNGTWIQILEMTLIEWRGLNEEDFFSAMLSWTSWTTVPGLPHLLKSPQISSNLKFLLKSCLISPQNVNFHENLLKSPQIEKIENSILAISLLSNTTNLSVRAVKHNLY